MAGWKDRLLPPPRSTFRLVHTGHLPVLDGVRGKARWKFNGDTPSQDVGCDQVSSPASSVSSWNLVGFVVPTRVCVMLSSYVS
jgi:hypothetical protein